MKSVPKWVIVTTSTIIVISLLFWILFYSVSFANKPSIVSLRSWYQDTFWNIESVFITKNNKFPPFDPIYTFQVQKWNDTNAYQFLGKFIKVDVNTNIIYLLGYDNKIYAFKVSNEFTNKQSDFTFLNPTYFPKQDTVIVDSFPFTQKSSVQLFWDDNRTLKQILLDYSKNKSRPLNSDSNRFFLVIKSG